MMAVRRRICTPQTAREKTRDILLALVSCALQLLLLQVEKSVCHKSAARSRRFFSADSQGLGPMQKFPRSPSRCAKFAYAVRIVSDLSPLIAACAAASLAIGTR